jgi:hypothetical protein
MGTLKFRAKDTNKQRAIRKPDSALWLIFGDLADFVREKLNLAKSELRNVLLCMQLYFHGGPLPRLIPQNGCQTRYAGVVGNMYRD